MERQTKQFLIPNHIKSTEETNYDIYPAHSIAHGNIEMGYATLCDALSSESVIIMDGYIGVDWAEIIASISAVFQEKEITITTFDIKECLKPEPEILHLIEPYLGGDDPIFGYRTPLNLADYFDNDKLKTVQKKDDTHLQIIYGTGASLCKVEGFLVYFDLPKNELHYRMRAGKVHNLGLSASKEPKQMYKHFYFVDWVILNKQKKKILPDIAIIVDQQRPGQPTWMHGETMHRALSDISKSYFRVRPWFEPGVWGGQWIKNKFSGLNKDVPNYAWSFEMIVPENGLLFESQGNILELSFDLLMYQERENILGKAASRFQDEFPIRFDFLDTFDGGNLSVQCHPGPAYIKNEFGENFTQDETYYILDAEDNTSVYLGFQQDIDPPEFKQALEQSFETKETLDIEKYVQKFPAKKHALFLIPHGTIHCSGKNTMVLEISATPYIFTFKMYDWQRLDLNGEPRHLNIERAFQNLNFERKGLSVKETLIANPIVMSSGKNWKKIHLPTHPDHFYDVYRYDFEDTVEINTFGQCHLLMLVEGASIELQINDNRSQIFNYAETFAIPAATKNYRLLNRGSGTARVVIAFVKETAC